MPIYSLAGYSLVCLPALIFGKLPLTAAGFVLYTIVRECIYYVNLRQAYLSSPNFAKRPSSRTMLITCVPERYLDERRLKKLYGDSAKRVFIPRTTKALAKVVEEREQTAKRLEDAHISLIIKGNAARKKFLKKNPDHPENRLPPPLKANEKRRKSAAETVDEDLEKGEAAPKEEDLPRGGQIHIDIPNPELELEHLQVLEDAAADAAVKKKNQVHIMEEETDYVHPYGLDPALPDLRGSVAAQWIAAEDRPHHRPIGNFLRRVDTIRWTRKRLQELNLQIFKMRRVVRRGETGSIPAAFIEFDTQESAQAAHQILAHHRPLQMSTKLLGIRPDEIVWSSLRMPWWERIMRKTGVFALIVGAIIFWALPTAFIGFVSNISNLIALVPFLKVLLLIPGPIMQFIQGFTPPLALTLWMSLVPYMLRFCGRASGLPSTIMVELFTQNNYFAFQVVQVFLVTTLTSAASAALTDVIKNPFGAKDLLAQNLPAASNFYLSYILIQCLMSGAVGILQIFGFLRHVILVKFTNNPRTRYKNWRQLKLPKWGALFPVYSNMGVIALSYACIAPLILVFAAGGLAFTHIIWRYNLIYVCDATHDSKGLFYPNALLHLIIGLYLAEVCLIGLFALKGAIVPVVGMVLFLLFTLVVHQSLSDSLKPLLVNLPQTLAVEEEYQAEDLKKEKLDDDASEEAAAAPQGAANDYYDTNQTFGDEATGEVDPEATPVVGSANSYYDETQTFGEENFNNSEVLHGEQTPRHRLGHRFEEEEDKEEEEQSDEHTVVNERALEGSSAIRSAATDWLKASAKDKMRMALKSSGIKPAFAKAASFVGIKPGQGPPSFLAKWLHPEEYEDFVALARLIPAEFAAPQSHLVDGDYKYCDYTPPDLWAPKPILWIPQDDAHISRQEVAQTRAYTPIFDRGASLDSDGRVIVHFEAAPFEDLRVKV